MTAKIGLFAIGLEAYWPQFKGIKERLLGHHRRLAEKFAGVELVEAGMVDNQARATEAGLKFQAADVDLLFCHLSTYASSDALLPVIRQLHGVPVVLMNVQADKAMDLDAVKGVGDWLGQGCTCAGFPEMTAVLRRFEHPFAVLTGHLDGDAELDREIRSWLLAAAAKRRLKSGSIGIFGRPYQGMMDLNVDETNIYRRFGSYVRHLNWEDIVDAMRLDAPKAVLADAVERLKLHFNVPADLDRASLDSFAKVYAALKNITEKHNLIAMCNHCEVQPSGELSTVVAMSNPVFSLMTQQGISCPVEGDVKTAIAMSVLKTIGGSATLAEPYSLDFNQDLCIVGHSGAGDPDIGDGKAALTLSPVFHGKPGSGFLTQFTPALGPVTITSLAQDAGGEYRLIAVEGELVGGKVMRLGDTNALFKFRRGLRGFANSWAEQGPTHHSTMGRGHHADALRKVGLLLGIPVDVI